MKYLLITVLAVLILKESVNDAKSIKRRKSESNLFNNQTNIKNLAETIILNKDMKNVVDSKNSYKFFHLNQTNNQNKIKISSEKNENPKNLKCYLKISICVIFKPHKT
jgi:hypothetical protein